MERFFDLIKRYPLWILGGVIALVLIFWYAGSGGGSGQPVIVSTGPSDATVAANAALEAKRIDAQMTGAAGVVAKELATIQAGAYSEFLSTSRDVADIQADRDVQIAGIAGNTQTSLASIITGATTTQTQIVADTTKDLANIDKAKTESLANIQAALKKEELAGQLASAKVAADAAIKINTDNIAAQQYTQKGQWELAQDWRFFTNPNNMSALFGQPISNTNVFMNGSNPLQESTAGSQ